MAKTSGRRSKTSSERRRTHRGGTYTVNVNAAPAGGFPEIDSIRESACGMPADRGGNNTFGGRRRKHKKTARRSKTSSGGRRHRKHRKTSKRGGAMQSSPNYPGLVYPTSDMALNVPRSGYGFVQGPGTAGLVDYGSIY